MLVLLCLGSARAAFPQGLSSSDLEFLQRAQPNVTGSTSLQMTDRLLSQLRAADITVSTTGRGRSYLVRPGELNILVVNLPVTSGSFALYGGGELLHTGGILLLTRSTRVVLNSPLLEIRNEIVRDTNPGPYAGSISFDLLVNGRSQGRLPIFRIDRFNNGFAGFNLATQDRREGISFSIDRGDVVLSQTGADALNRAFGVSIFRDGLPIAEAALALVVQGEE